MSGRDDRRDRSGEYDPQRSDRGRGGQQDQSAGPGPGSGPEPRGQQPPGQGGQGRGYDQGRQRRGGRQPPGGGQSHGYGPAGGQSRYNTDVIGARIGAQIIDNILFSVLFFGTLIVAGASGAVVSGPSGSGAGGVVTILLVLVGLAAGIFYLFLLEGYWNGQTVGKRVLNVRVIKKDGSEIGYVASIIRNFIELFESLFYYIPGLIVIALSDDNQRLGDHAAGTIVVKDPDRSGGQYADQSYQQHPPQQQPPRQQPPQQGASGQRAPQQQPSQQRPPRESRHDDSQQQPPRR